MITLSCFHCTYFCSRCRRNRFVQRIVTTPCDKISKCHIQAGRNKRTSQPSYLSRVHQGMLSIHHYKLFVTLADRICLFSFFKEIVLLHNLKQARHHQYQASVNMWHTSTIVTTHYEIIEWPGTNELLLLNYGST